MIEKREKRQEVPEKNKLLKRKKSRAKKERQERDVGMFNKDQQGI